MPEHATDAFFYLEMVECIFLFLSLLKQGAHAGGDVCGLARTYAHMNVHCYVCRVCVNTQCHHKHTLGKRKRTKPCVVLEACNGSFVGDNTQACARTHTAM